MCAGIVCNALILDHGTVIYTTDSQAPYDYGTVATLFCNDDFELIGNNISTCSGDGKSIEGTWTGDVPYCELLYVEYNTNRGKCVHLIVL